MKIKIIIITIIGAYLLLVGFSIWLSSINKGVIVISTNPTGAEFYIDSQITNTFNTPSELKVKAGKHNIWVVKTGYDPIIQQIEVKARKTNYLNFNLTQIVEPSEGAPI